MGGTSLFRAWLSDLGAWLPSWIQNGRNLDPRWRKFGFKMAEFGLKWRKFGFKMAEIGPKMAEMGAGLQFCGRGFRCGDTTSYLDSKWRKCGRGFKFGGGAVKFGFKMAEIGSKMAGMGAWLQI